ncbi:Uncharacterised protein [Mycobacterium tuberculosis]|uniref:Uncharacterized protein n=1 Tax=Mycobacterium tuberculosis TaxID=1773 RepID=A0A655ARR8_MYCTX|nr:Uncharacterised protein [Mycobacterium tuberculosis]
MNIDSSEFYISHITDGIFDSFLDSNRYLRNFYSVLKVEIDICCEFFVHVFKINATAE